MYGIMNKQVKKFVKLIFFIFVFYSLNIVTLSAAEDPLSKLLNKGFKIITEQKLTESKIQPLFEEKNLFITYNSKIYEFSFDRVGFFEVFDDIQKINSGTWKISGLFQNAILLNFEKNFEEKKELYFQLYPDLKKISTLTTLVNPDSDEQTDRPVKYADKQVAKKERVSKIEKIEEEKRLALQKKITAEKEAKRIAAKKVKAEEESRLAKAEEEAKRIAAEKIKAEEESKRIAAEKIKAEEEVGRLANEKQKLEKELQKYKLEENKKLFLEEEKKYGRKCTKGTFFSKRDLFEIGSEEYKTCIKNKGPEKQLEEKKRSQSEKIKAVEAKKIVAKKLKDEEEEATRIAAEKVKVEEINKKLLQQEKQNLVFGREFSDVINLAPELVDASQEKKFNDESGKKLIINSVNIYAQDDSMYSKNGSIIIMSDYSVKMWMVTCKLSGKQASKFLELKPAKGAEFRIEGKLESYSRLQGFRLSPCNFS